MCRRKGVGHSYVPGWRMLPAFPGGHQCQAMQSKACGNPLGLYAHEAGGREMEGGTQSKSLRRVEAVRDTQLPWASRDGEGGGAE